MTKPFSWSGCSGMISRTTRTQPVTPMLKARVKYSRSISCFSASHSASDLCSPLVLACFSCISHAFRMLSAAFGDQIRLLSAHLHLVSSPHRYHMARVLGLRQAREVLALREGRRHVEDHHLHGAQATRHVEGAPDALVVLHVARRHGGLTAGGGHGGGDRLEHRSPSKGLSKLLIGCDVWVQWILYDSILYTCMFI